MSRRNVLQEDGRRNILGEILSAERGRLIKG
jgi:hypothetical protein